MTAPCSSGQPRASVGQHKITAFLVRTLWLGRVLEQCGNDTKAEMVVEAQADFDEALGALTSYVLSHEQIAAAYAAEAGGGRDAFGMTHDSDAAVKNQRSDYTTSEDRAK